MLYNTWEFSNAESISSLSYKYHYSTKLNITSLLLSVLLQVHSMNNNVDGNKQVLFFSV